MEVVHTAKFVIGIVFGLLGLAMLYQARGSRGFGQKRQLGLLLLVAAAIFIALGLGVDIKGMIGL
jgi:drug/metabolite transporter (DMT)-like permease